MATDVEIANLALAHLGETGTVANLNPPNGSAQAVHCARFYPIARDALLAAYPWGFSTRRTTPAQLTPEASSYAYAYQFPTNAVCIFAVQPPNASNDTISQWNESVLTSPIPELANVAGAVRIPQNFTVETLASGQKVIYTNVKDAVVRYGVRIIDTSKFDPLFVNALGRLLAAYVAGPLIKGRAGREESKFQYQMFRQEVGIAEVQDAQQTAQRVNHVPSWVAGR